MNCDLCKSATVVDYGIVAYHDGKKWQQYWCANCGHTWSIEKVATKNAIPPPAPKSSPYKCLRCGAVDRYVKSHSCAALLCADCYDWIAGCGNDQCDCPSGWSRIIPTVDDDEPITERFLEKVS